MSEFNYVLRGKVTPGPHIRSTVTSLVIMKQVMIALLFPTVAAVYFFGFKVLILIVISILIANLLEVSWHYFRKKSDQSNDLTATITGWLLALTLPVTVPVWILIVGNFLAILFIKELSGGIGYNLFNPAVYARVLLKLFFSDWITNWVSPGTDVVTTATPLETIGYFRTTLPLDFYSWTDLFFGFNLGGPVGETSKAALILAFLYLVFKKIINPWVPLLVIFSCFGTMFLYSGDFRFASAHVLSGALVFAAIFMVTDYTTTPYTDRGKYLFAIGCGVLTAILRIIIDLPGGIGVAILLMNLLTPIINRYTMTRIYGS